MSSSFQLPKGVAPTNYKLFFEIDLEKFKFRGKETIDLEISKPTDKIVLNARDLNIKNAAAMQKGDALVPKIKLENKKEIVSFKFGSKIKGLVKLVVEFDGVLNDDLIGLYRSKYTENGRTKYLATTQFEAPYARMAFPCFDEPNHKATFDVTVKVDKKLQAISNMPIKTQSADGGKKVVKFGRTPRMSTYLLYIGVGEFEFLEDKRGRIPIRIITTLGKKGQAGFALDMTKKFLNYFEKYSGIRYALPKLDMIALPDFAAGAMENWGAITFREIYLLFDPKLTSTPVKKRIAMIIAHELWHQWSGNLVTMKWWNDLWLNESFATYMAYKAVDSLYPEWDMWEEFVRDEMDKAFSDDSLKTTHPIEVKVEDPHIIEEIFDAISYSKGGSILRMLDNYLGEEAFRKGIGIYLSKYKYGNATSEDLWKSLSKTSGKPVDKIMSSWIRQAGYPIVDASMPGSELILTQRKFMFNKKDETTKWLIPLVARLNSGNYAYIVDKKEHKLPFKSSAMPILNYNQSGFYRVKYPEDLVPKLGESIANLPVLNRWSIQDDMFQMSINDDKRMTDYLEFVKCYNDENNYLVLAGIASNMRSIHSVFSQEKFWLDIWPKFRSHFMRAFKRALSNLGWDPKEGERQSHSLLRSLAIRYLAFIEEPEVLDVGMKKFEDYVGGKAELHPDLRSPVFYIATLSDNESVYKQLVNLYQKTKSPEERIICLQSLGQFRNSNLLEKFLEFAFTEKVRVQDLPIAISSVASNPYSRRILWNWVKKNWRKVEKFKGSGKIFISIVESVVSSCVGKDYEKDIIKFFRSHPVKYRMTIEKSLERVRRKTFWLESNKSLLTKYFD
ncbi:MAG: M1 family metallopeptidase [Candidatus Aenigmarchaeota archaeon]|nr:M1 family metallopeptidase [Candidatus Aenigmarchaeota archaeon]